MADLFDEAESLFAEPVATPSAMYTPVAPAPAPTQLQSLVDQPTRAPTDIELGVAQLRAMSPLEQTAAELEGRKLLFQEGLSFGVLPKVGAAATSLKEALYGTPLTEAFGQAVTEQDVLKEFVRQQELEKQNTILGVTGPELAGSLVSPIGRLYTPIKVAKTTPLATALAIRAANVGQAAGVGAGTAGLQTFLSTPGTLEERIAAGGESAETGAMYGGAAGGIGQVFSAAAPKLQSFGKAARRSAIGATAADYRKTAGKRNFVPKEEGVYTLTQQGIDNVIDKGYLGNSLDPLMQSDNLETAVRTLENKLDANIAKVDASGVNVKTPQFISIVRQNQKGEFGGVNKVKYAAEIDRIKNDIAAQRTNRLEYLQTQKKIYGTLYDPSGTTTDAKFNRAVYHELQSAIENYVPDAKNINEEVQSLILTRPIIERRKAQAGAAGNQIFNALARATYTTGGLFGAGARLAGAGPLTSAALAAGTRAAATPTGRNLIGQALTGGGLAEGGLATGLRAGQIASRPDIVPIPDLSIATVENADRPQYVNGQELADALKSQVDKAPMLSERSPSDVTDLKYDTTKLDDLYKQNNLGTLVINKTKGTQTFIPGYQPNIPNELASSEDEVEIRPQVKEILPAKTESQSGQDWLAEAESFLNSKQPEAVKVGKQNVSIPTGEGYSELRLVKAVIGAESAFNPSAVSSVGAAGLMQLMPGTAKQLGVKDVFNPKQNVEGGSRYLQQQINEFGSIELGLAAYNWGPKNIALAKKKLEAQGEPVTWENVKSITRVPSETREYVKKVMLLRKYDDFDLAKIAVKVGEAKLDEVLSKYKTAGKFTVGDVLDDLGIDAKDVRVKRGNVLQAANNLIEA